MATDPKTIIDVNADPGLTHPTGYVPKKDFDAGQQEVKTVVINYTDPAPYGVPELQIFNDPGGANGSVQYNLANRLVGDGNFVWNYKTRTLSVLGNVRVSNNIAGYITTNTKHFKFTGGNVGDTLITDGHGNLSWVPPSEASYGNANVANFLPTYTGNITANVVTANTITVTHSNLGNVANITILGGSNGQFLSTDGNGHLSWHTASGGGGNTSIIISDTAPLDVTAGSVWFNSIEARAYIYYDSTWVDLSPTVLPPPNDTSTVTISDTNPGIQNEGDIWFNSIEGRSYVAYKNAWVDMSPAVMPNPDMFANTITFPDGTYFDTANFELISYGNSNVANYLPNYTGTLQANDLKLLNMSEGQLLITGPGNSVVGGPDLVWDFGNASLFTTGLDAVNLHTTGTVILGDVSNLHIDGGTNGYVLSTDGTGSLSWVPQTGGPGGDYSNTNVASYLSSGTVTTDILTTANISAGKVTVAGNITSLNANLGNLVAGNYFRGNGALLTQVTAANVIGTVSNAAYSTNAGTATIAGTVTNNTQSNITSLGTLANLTVSGNATIGNVSGLITTANQPNITSLGTLANITVAGDSNLANVSLSGNITSDLNVTGNIVGGAVRTTSSSTAPSSPVAGDMWFNTTTGIWYRYTSDTGSSYWLDINGPFTTSPTVPVVRSIVNQGQPVVMDNIQVQMALSGNRSLQIKTITGTLTFAVSAQSTYFAVGASHQGYSAGVSLTANTTFQWILPWSFVTAGDTATYSLLDQTNNRVYRLTLIVGQNWNNNFIQIERLI